MNKHLGASKTLLVIALLIISIYFIKNCIFTFELTGKYIVKNQSDRLNSQLDTLIINPDLSFRNHQWGFGSVKLKYSLKGTKIKFSYKYEMGEGLISKSIQRNFLGDLIITLNKDLEIEYVKIE